MWFLIFRSTEMCSDKIAIFLQAAEAANVKLSTDLERLQTVQQQLEQLSVARDELTGAKAALEAQLSAAVEAKARLEQELSHLRNEMQNRDREKDQASTHVINVRICIICFMYWSLLCRVL
jgi:chromosome segregation ATPase